MEYNFHSTLVMVRFVEEGSPLRLNGSISSLSTTPDGDLFWMMIVLLTLTGSST